MACGPIGMGLCGLVAEICSAMNAPAVAVEQGDDYRHVGAANGGRHVSAHGAAEGCGDPQRCKARARVTCRQERRAGSERTSRHACAVHHTVLLLALIHARRACHVNCHSICKL